MVKLSTDMFYIPYYNRQGADKCFSSGSCYYRLVYGICHHFIVVVKGVCRNLKKEIHQSVQHGWQSVPRIIPKRQTVYCMGWENDIRFPDDVLTFGTNPFMSLLLVSLWDITFYFASKGFYLSFTHKSRVCHCFAER